MSEILIRKGYTKCCFGHLHYRFVEPIKVKYPIPLICFHMSPYSSIVYDNFLKCIGKNRFTLAMDTPGFGDSDPPKHIPQISDYTKVVPSLLKKFNFETVNIIGYHTGSSIAVDTAVQFPNLVKRLVLISAPVWKKHELKVAKNEFSAKENRKNGSHLSDYWVSAVKWSMDGRSLNDIARIFSARLMNPSISWWGHRAAFEYDISQSLLKIMKPILILNPEDDLRKQTYRAQEFLLHHESKIYDLNDWGHGFLDIKTNSFVKIVDNFLNS